MLIWAHVDTLSHCRVVSWPAGVSSGLVLISSGLLLQLVHSLSVTVVSAEGVTSIKCVSYYNLFKRCFFASVSNFSHLNNPKQMI